METKNPIVNYPTPPTTTHNFSTFSFNIKRESEGYPYTYSPSINNCISKDNTSPNMNMNNYSNINMYNTTSIISNNNGSSFNSPNNNNNSYNQGTNNYQASNQAQNNISSFPSSYSNINYTNINTSIQPLSPKELSYVEKSQVFINNSQNGSNQSSQQNYINYNSYSDPNQIDNNKNIRKNDQKLTIDTSLNNANDTQSTFYNYSSGSNDSYDIKTPTSAKNPKGPNQMSTPPMTPLPEKNKKKRGDHIHYNIKTNMFNETQQYYEVLDMDKSKSFNLKIIPKVDRGFFPTGPEKDFTCYRRNYFQISVSFSADNIKNPAEFTTPCYLKVGNEMLKIENFYIGICAKVKNTNKEIRVVQQTAKREKGPQNKPALKLCKPGGNPNYYHGLTSNQSIVTFERLQFKSATPNSSKRAATQQFYALVIELYADTPERKYKIATIESKRLIVRGRSPGHYLNNIAFNDPSLSNNSFDSNHNPYYDDNHGFGNPNGPIRNSSGDNYSNFNNGPNSNQMQNNYNTNYTNEQNMNFMNNGQFNPSMDQSFQANNGQPNSNSNTFATAQYTTIQYNNNRNGIDNSAYSEGNNNPGMNYQGQVPSTSGSFYSQNQYMYQTPPLPPQQNPQPINTSIPYNVPKQEIVSPFSSDNQNTYPSYVQGQVSGIFTTQSQPTQSYPSDNYYAQNANSNGQMNQQPLPQNANQSSYYSSNNLFTNNQQQNSANSSMNTNYAVPSSWNSNGGTI